MPEEYPPGEHHRRLMAASDGDIRTRALFTNFPPAKFAHPGKPEVPVTYDPHN